MKAIAEQRLEALEELALEEGPKHIRAFLKYEGNDARYLNRAKLMGITIGAFSRLRASESNRQSVELMVKKFEGGGGSPAALAPPRQKVLKGA